MIVYLYIRERVCIDKTFRVLCFSLTLLLVNTDGTPFFRCCLSGSVLLKQTHCMTLSSISITIVIYGPELSTCVMCNNVIPRAFVIIRCM